VSGKDVKKDIPAFDDFYLNEFDNVRELVPQGFSLRSFFDRLKEKNYRLILATNPFFPINASKTRLEWLGLSTEDFEYITTMENSSYTKPNPKYYENIFDVCGLKAEECLMVGNNPIEDMCAEKLGCKVFLMPEYIENKTNVDCTDFPQGDFDDLEKFIENLEEQK
ncbi:MAG: HAD family hydrolase, partial [Clostridia bacterium]